MTVYTPEEFEVWQNEMSERAKYVMEKDSADLYWGWKWVSNN